MFGFEHEQFRASVHKFLEKEAAPFHAQWEKQGHIDRGLWNKAGEAGLPGFDKGKRLEKVGMKARDTSELFFQNVRIPKDNLLGQLGQGFAYLMQELPQERLTVAIAALSCAEAALQWTLDYTRDRKAFGKAISDFQNTRFKLAEIATEGAASFKLHAASEAGREPLAACSLLLAAPPIRGQGWAGPCGSLRWLRALRH